MRRLAGALLIAAAIVGAGPAPGQVRDEAILPLESHAPEARPLAEEYRGELRRLQADLARCAPELAVQRHGMAFRRPRRAADGPPYLTLWVWLDPTRPPAAPALPTRAAEAFSRYGHRVFAVLLARSAVLADPRVGGYGLILTWIGPVPRGGRVVGESLAVFADKLAVASFIHETIGPATLLSRAVVRLFDGETELSVPSLELDDAGASAAAC